MGIEQDGASRPWRTLFFAMMTVSVVASNAVAQDSPQPTTEPKVITSDGTSESDFADVSLDDLLDTKVIFSASKRAQTIDDSPSAISVITAEDIRSMGAVSIIDVFRRLPGVYVYVRSGNNPALSIRGRTASFPSGILLLVDGVSLYDATNGGVDWSRAPLVLDDIERVELIRGPGGTLYGSNAFYGVINVTTKRPSTDSTVRSITTGGTGYTVHQYASTAARTGGFSLRLSGKFEQSDGFSEGISKPSVFDSHTLGNFLLRADYAATEKTEVSAQFSARFGHRDYLGTQVNRPNNPQPIFNGYYYGGIKHTPGADDAVEFKTYGFLMWEKYETLNVTYAPGASHFNGELAAINNELNWNHAVSSSVDLLAGAHHRYQYSFSPAQAFVGFDLSNGFDPNGTTNWSVFDRPRINQQIASAYVQLEAREGRWMIVNTGVRFEYDTFTDSVNPSPRISLLFRPAEDHTVRLGVARSTRIPSVLEHGLAVANFPEGSTLFNLTGNHNLSAEKITAVEIGYRGNFAERKYSLNLETFIQHIESAIANRGQSVGTAPYTFFGNTVDIETYDNKEDFRALGFEIEATAAPVKWQTIRANYTYTKEFSKESNLVSGYTTGARNTTPAHMFNFVAETTLPTRTKLFLGGSYRSEFAANDNLFNQQVYINDGFRFDLTLSQGFWDDRVILSAIGQNVFDTEGATTINEAVIASPANADNKMPQSVYGRLEIKI